VSPLPPVGITFPDSRPALVTERTPVMASHRARTAIPPLFGILVLLGFIISPTVGVIVAVVGAMLSALAWSSLRGPRGARRGRSTL